jgi:hypothetical protein
VDKIPYGKRLGIAAKKTRCLRFTPQCDSAAAEDCMKRFVEGSDRGQSTLFPKCLDDWVDENNSFRLIDVCQSAAQFAPNVSIDMGNFSLPLQCRK